MGTKSMAYDHAAYLTRMQHQPGAQVAGASKAFDKFAAFTAMKAYAIGVSVVTAGTSTYTAWNGTATVTANPGDQVQGLKLSGTTTTTYGPYAINGTAGQVFRIQISGTGGAGQAAADGGVDLAAGDTFQIVRGTDATAVIVPCLEYSLTPGASVTA
jgi:hypothetical protein